MAGRQDPPGHALVIIAGPKAGADGKNGRMGPPGGDRPGAAGQKETPTTGDIIRADSHCIDCQNYNPQDGSCAKWNGSFDPQDACFKYFSALSDQEPDADDQADGMSDQDSDDDNGGGQAA